ncbi:MAG: alpha/beta family hydrolase [Porticoccus sp.]
MTPISFSDAVQVHWLEDGDHDLKPRKRSGLLQSEHLKTVAVLVSELARLG